LFVTNLDYDVVAANVVALTQGHTMKFEIDFGAYSNSKLVIETHDFDIIDIFQKFVEFQEFYGWAVEYEATTALGDEFEDDTEEELDGAETEAAAEAAKE